MAAVQLTASIKQEPTDEAPGTTPPDQSHSIFPEPVNLVDLEERILQLCSEHPKGITDDVITQDQPLVDADRRCKALQRLLSQGKIDLLKQGSILLYRLKTTSSTLGKMKGFEVEERLVYQIIEDSGNKGIWIRDIRIKSNLGQTHIAKIVKTLESKKLIKSVKSVQASKKKVYMLYDVTPDESLTGGAWYSDQEFESEFVEVLNQHCYKFLQRKAFKAGATHTDPISRSSASLCSIEEVWKFITELGISKVKLSRDNIRMILDTLVFDGLAEVLLEVQVVSGGSMERQYRVAKPVLLDTGFSRVPCGICPATLHSESFEVEFHRLVMASYFTENNFALYYGISHDCHDNTLL